MASSYSCRYISLRFIAWITRRSLEALSTATTFERNVVVIVAEVDQAAIARGVVGSRLVEDQATVLDNPEDLVVSDSMPSC
jgi:hypothetical protein